LYSNLDVKIANKHKVFILYIQIIISDIIFIVDEFNNGVDGL